MKTTTRRVADSAKRSLMSALVMLMVATGLVLVGATPAAAAADVTPERLSGSDRFGTAAEIAEATFDTATTAVLARGRAFPDALAGSALAGTVGAPVLLVDTDVVPTATKNALASLGVEDVVLLGGEAAISADVEESLRGTYGVTRVAGPNRYATAADVALEIGADGVGVVDGKKTVFVATGQKFADALAVGPLAYDGGHPIVLTPSETLADEAADTLNTLGVEHAILLGGTAALSDTVKQSIEALGVTTERIGGTNRQETATEIAEFALDSFAFPGATVLIARGDDFPDALAGGPNGGEDQGVVLLTNNPDTIGSAAEGWLAAHSDTITVTRALGGTAAVSDTVLADAESAAETGPPSQLDLQPEEQSEVFGEDAVLTATVTADPPEGSTARQPVPGVDVVFDVEPDTADENTALTLTGTTDGDGVASVSYTREDPGTDTVTAEVESDTTVSDTAVVEWAATAEPAEINPGTGKTLPVGDERDFTVTLVDPSTGNPTSGTVAISARDLFDERADPDRSQLDFSAGDGGTVAEDTDDSDHVLATMTIDDDGTATLTVASNAAQEVTFLVFLDEDEDGLLDSGEPSDPAGTTTWEAREPQLTVTPVEAATVPTGDDGDRQYTVSAVDQFDDPFTGVVDVGFVEATTDAEIEKVDGTDTAAGDEKHADLTLGDDASGTFTIGSATATSATPVVWFDRAGGTGDVRDSGEPKKEGGATTWEAPEAEILVTPSGKRWANPDTQQVYEISVQDQFDRDMAATVDVGFDELLDGNAETSTIAEIVWYDNDSPTRTTPGSSNAAPSGTSGTSAGTRHVEFQVNSAGRASFAVWAKNETAGTPVVWSDAGTDDDAPADGEPQDLGGTTTWEPLAPTDITVTVTDGDDLTVTGKQRVYRVAVTDQNGNPITATVDIGFDENFGADAAGTTAVVDWTDSSSDPRTTEDEDDTTADQSHREVPTNGDGELTFATSAPSATTGTPVTGTPVVWVDGDSNDDVPAGEELQATGASTTWEARELTTVAVSQSKSNPFTSPSGEEQSDDASPGEVTYEITLQDQVGDAFTPPSGRDATLRFVNDSGFDYYVLYSDHANVTVPANNTIPDRTVTLDDSTLDDSSSYSFDVDAAAVTKAIVTVTVDGFDPIEHSNTWRAVTHWTTEYESGDNNTVHNGAVADLDTTEDWYIVVESGEAAYVEYTPDDVYLDGGAPTMQSTWEGKLSTGDTVEYTFLYVTEESQTHDLVTDT